MSTTRHLLRHMRWIAGGTFQMGSADFYPEERPVHRVTVDGFWMDEHPVTVGEYRRFVTATGYQTVAQRPLGPADYPDADPALLVPGAPSTCATTATGGPTCPGPTGSIPSARVAAAAAAGTR